jgi:hypothetical protein
MSLSWRKRQALASDQKSWRALGLDSALWNGIEKNSGNVKVALSGTTSTTTEGIVTGLKFTRTGTLSSIGATSEIYYVSDACNNTVAAVDGINKFSTGMDPSHNVLGNGLTFNAQYFGEVANTAVGQDISAVKISILDGGSGYSVGQTFNMNQAPVNSAAVWSGNVIGQITEVTSTKIEPGRN